MEILDYLIQPYKNVSALHIILEIIASVFGIASVVFSSRRKIWVFPMGIISTLLYTYIYFKMNIVGNMFINVYYTVMSIYGWFLWSKNVKEHHNLEVSYLNSKDKIISVVLFLLSGIFVYLNYYYQSFIYDFFGLKAPEEYSLNISSSLDILTTSLFFVGMWMMAKAKIENWIIWIIGDIICAFLMFYNGLFISGIQFLLLTVLAFQGWKNWKRSA